MTRLRLLHLHSSFAAGGAAPRAAKLMDAFGRQVEHAVVSAVPGDPDAAQALAAKVAVTFPDDFPALSGWPFPRRLLRIAQAMQGHDLILTYGWGAIDAVLAHTFFAEALGLPPLVHHEDDPAEAEAGGPGAVRIWLRRIALARAQGLVVPSQRLEFIARQAWKQPRRMVHRIAPGIPVADYGKPCAPDALPRVIKRKDERWLGALAVPGAAQELPALVRAMVPLGGEWQLVILGDAAARNELRQLAIELGIGHRVHVPGVMPDLAKVLGLFDLFAVPGEDGEFPLTVVQAMAAGLPLIGARRGGAEALIAPENRRFLTSPGDEAALAAALGELARDKAARRALGQANRVKAAAEFDEAAMIAAYRDVYAAALGRTAFP